MSHLDDICRVWQMVKESFRDGLCDAIIDLWFTGLEIVSFSDSKLTMAADSEIKTKVLTMKYKEDIERRFGEMLGFDITVEFVCAESSEELDAIRVAANYQKIRNGEETVTRATTIGSTMPPFNFEYTFENFIVGESNKFVHAACLAIADRLSHDYNPLFIYGPSGLGKTHLLYAITNELQKKKRDINVIYIKSEDFTNQMIDSLARQAMADFREKYRSCDVLLVDDIQFIAGKNSTQEEFFHTFNAIRESGGQIILTSDRSPREIKDLEERLVTRFEWGIVADIQPPDLELRIAIIKKKAEQANVNIPDDVLTFLAENLRSNIRQIEGAIKKLGAMAFISGNNITMEVARKCIAELLGDAEPIAVTLDKIFAAIYKKYNIRREDILSSKRNKEIASARHISIYLLRSIAEMSLPSVGRLFGRDHSTVHASEELIKKKMAQSPLFAAEIDELIKEIKGK
ncbi:MAG: chromosomal replication initiator protein DnaA [Ruminococcaceae bacterium]|nr:chromosomal replication initiator protein DnaA [Oscillospiraceae bacterium]